MLVNLTPNLAEIERTQIIAKKYDFKLIPQSDSRLLFEEGIYRSNFDFNFSKEEFMEELTQSIDNIEYNWKYGVADNIEQIKDYLKKYIDDLENKYVIAITPVFQDEDNRGKGGGWRWHKWGPYIGELNPQCEYLDDEEFGNDFKYVLCFSLYKIVK